MQMVISHKSQNKMFKDYFYLNTQGHKVTMVQLSFFRLKTVKKRNCVSLYILLNAPRILFMNLVIMNFYAGV